MAEFVLKYADARGQIKQEIAEAGSEQELRERFTQQGFLVYSVKARGKFDQLAPSLTGANRKKKLNLEKFLIFNQQFVTLIKAGLPILKSLDLLATRLTDARMSPLISAVRDDVRVGTSLSDAFAKQGVFPPIYVTSLLAGERSGALVEVLERFVSYQRMTLAVRKKLIASLIYPSLLIVLVLLLVVFLITYVVPQFSSLYSSMNAKLPLLTTLLISFGETAQEYLWVGVLGLAGAVAGLRAWSKTGAGQEMIDRIKLKMPIAGEIWIKYQVAQFARVLSTLLLGGIPLIQALETAAASVGTRVLSKALESTRKSVREGQTLSSSLNATGVFPPLALDMIEVGESTGALPAMLGSVAEFFEDDVQTRLGAALSLIEPAIMIFMGIFVAFVLVALYLPIFSLADTVGG
ncbi:MAG: type II secretion system F family protein [Acidobacteriota bacterium]|jgi:type IV pilus assembly protein PilC|nr:type II secretion system F family protein [Bryobacteraceae bacterium CoA2 C42]MCA2966313.1 type II secretion system F family protein [Acidobacteriaceae bacterium]